MTTILLTPWYLRLPIALDEIFVVLLALGSLLAVRRELWRLFRPYRKVRHGIARIGYHFRIRNVVHIFGHYRELPTIAVTGLFPLTEEEKRIQKTIPVPEENDPHAIVVVEPEWTQAKLHFEVQGLEYHEVKALRHDGKQELQAPCRHKRPGVDAFRSISILSANGIILCRELKQLILHYRSSRSATYPLCYHTLGGSYMPPGIKVKDDLDSLKNTLTREVDEEARIKLSFDHVPDLLVMQEVRTGFIQVAFLGITITAQQAEHLPDNPRAVEGKPVKIHFDQLRDLLMRPDWVPTGKAAVLAWLALGAPGAGPYPKFGKLSAAALCEEILATDHIEHGVVVSQAAGR